MKIFKLILLVLATAIFAINFWTINYTNLLSSQSMWAYVRIAGAFFIMVVLVLQIRKKGKRA